MKIERFRDTYLKDIRQSSGCDLDGRRIVLGITGSIAAVECPKLARELMRLGADVHVCMTPAARDIVTTTTMHWATGNPVITELTGDVEHLYLAGEWQETGSLFLVAPSTANTIAKMALGIDDTVVTTVATSAIGSGIPVLVAPGMHHCMAQHPAVAENLERLQRWGVEIIEPVVVEGKAKMAPVETLVEAVRRRLGPRDLEGRHVLVTAGPTVEHLDPVRVITNLSSGRMGVALAEVALRRGARVTLVYGPGTVPPPRGVEVIRTTTTAEMRDAVQGVLSRDDADVSIFAAAVCDFAPVQSQEEKVATREGGTWTVDLAATPKLIAQARQWTQGLIVAFKAETTTDDQVLLRRAGDLLEKGAADLVVANRVGPQLGFLTEDNEVFVLARGEHPRHVPRSPKPVVASAVVDEIVATLGAGGTSAAPRSGSDVPIVSVPRIQ